MAAKPGQFMAAKPGNFIAAIRCKFIVTLLLAIALIFCTTVFAEAAAFDTKRFDVSLVLEENNSFTVTETIKVHFNEARHGLYRYIPYRGITTRVLNGTEIQEKYRLKISDVRVEGYPFETYRENGNLVIQIGSGDVYVSGAQEYRISYRCTLYDDENTAFDSFYWNIIPQGWTTPIEASSLSISMPKSFDAGKAEFITGAYGRTDTEAVRWVIEETEITAYTDRVLAAGEGVTLNILLPEGYFSGELSMVWMKWAMMALIILSPLLSFLLWLRFGRDPQIIRTVEFYPPDGVTPAETGYIIDGAVDTRDIVSLIIYWANGGFLKIEEGEKNHFTLIKLKELPDSARTYEHTMFQGLFDGRERVTPEDLKEEFYGTFEATKGQLKAHFTMNKGNRIFTQSSLGARAMGILLMVLPLLSLTVFGIFLNRSEDYLTITAVPAVLFAVAGFSLFLSAYDRKDSYSKARLTGLYLGGVICLMIFGISALAYSFITLGNLFPGLSVILASLVSLMFTMRMKQRTKKSSQLLGRLLGLREFIRIAELDRIKRLVDERPDYFYHVLPYAYVFGLTEKWAKKFETLAVPPPGWYSASYGNPMFNTWIFMNSFNHYTHAMQQNISIPPAPTGGSGAGGGGFTGGGGFSGGGMGGGGGGSW